MNTFNLTLDVDKSTRAQAPVTIGQGDRSGTTITATVYDHGTLLTHSGLTARFKMRLPDGRYFYSTTASWSYSTGTVSVTIDETQAASAPGTTNECYFELLSGSTVVYSTSRFTIRVLRSATEAASTARSYDDRVEELLNELGELPAPSTTLPVMDGSASYGSGNDYARGNHVHPTDTTRASASDLSGHMQNNTAHVTQTERDAWNAKASTNTATTSSNGLMSSSDKSKLNGIASNATANTASNTSPIMDGSASPGSATAYARADHVHPTDTSRASASDLSNHTQNSTAHVTAAERETWNGKAGTAVASASANGLMSKSDKQKLDGIAENANAYVLPTASTSVKGGVKVDGTSITIDANGVIHTALACEVVVTSVKAGGSQVTGVTVTVREGDATGEVVAMREYEGSPLTFVLPLGFHYHITASDVRMYGPCVAAGTVSATTTSVALTYAPLSSVLVKSDGVYTNASLTEFWNRQRDGKAYGMEMPKSTSTACVKVGDNAGVADPVPSTLAQVGSDPYATGRFGPYLHYDVNGYVDNDGTPHVTAIDGIDPSFARDGTNGNVWSMCPVLYEKWSEDSDSVTWSVSDTARSGYSPQQGAKLPDGTMRPYMLYAKYGGGMYDGAYASVSGVHVRIRDVSHNSLITITGSATTGYSGRSVADDWYLKMLWDTKYANKDKQTYMQGCTSYYLDYQPTVAESGVRRVIIAKANAANLVVGSNVSLGSSRASNSVFGCATITSIEDYDASNSAVNLDVESAFTTTTDLHLSTMPWNTGVTDGITFDGSPSSNTNGKEPYVINGIETAYGCYEIVSGVIISNDGVTGWVPYVVADTRRDATSLTSDFVSCGAALPTSDADAWKYLPYTSSHRGLVYGTDIGGSMTAGRADGHYVNKLETVGTREWLALGYLGHGRVAGPFCVVANYSLSGADWSLGGRLSATGRSA